MIKYPFLIVTQEDYTDPTGILAHSEAEFGGEGHIEFNDSRSVVIGTYYAETEEEAIAQAAEEWEVSTEVFTSYRLAMETTTPLEEAVMKEIELMVDEAYEEDYADQRELIAKNINAISTNIADAFEDFTADVRQALDNVLTLNNYEEGTENA